MDYRAIGVWLVGDGEGGEERWTTEEEREDEKMWGGRAEVYTWKVHKGLKIELHNRGRGPVQECNKVLFTT